MICPNCKESKLVMSERNGIEIDYCPDCRGIWLDRGELDKIIERARGSEALPRAEASAPQYRSYPQPESDDRYPGDRGYKRKKSFFEELFD